jgi:PAS domain S-box-containing protein
MESTCDKLLSGPTRLIGTLSYIDSAKVRKDREELKATRTIRIVTDSLLLALKDAEAAQRGFLLTGQAEYLEPSQERTATIHARLDALDGLIAHQTPQQDRVDRLRVLVGSKLAELDQTIRVKQTQGVDAALAIVRTDRGRILMNKIRATADDITSVSDRRVAEVTTNAQARSDRTRFVSVIGSIILLVLFLAATVMINRGIRRSQQLTQAIAEKELETGRTRDLLRTTLTSISDAVVATDASGLITFLNLAAERLTGWTADLAVGKPAREIFYIVSEVTLEPVESPLDVVLRQGKTVGLSNHTLLIAKDGHPISIDDSAAPMRDESGKNMGAVLVFRDISSRRKNEKALEKSERRFRAASARAPVGMVLTSLDGTFVYSNQTYSDIIGYSPSELPEINFLSLTHPEQVVENRMFFERL